MLSRSKGADSAVFMAVLTVSGESTPLTRVGHRLIVFDACRARISGRLLLDMDSAPLACPCFRGDHDPTELKFPFGFGVVCSFQAHGPLFSWASNSISFSL